MQVCLCKHIERVRDVNVNLVYAPHADNVESMLFVVDHVKVFALVLAVIVIFIW